ncbi:MAG: YfhO family protein [Chlorobi bacterium]|nr:YfhO family protein [Chlorobiota bacterium]
MKKDFFKEAAPYLVAIIVFLAITLVYFSPLLEGKKLKQHDIAMWKGMSKEISDFRQQTGEEALWTNSMFGGMPAWQISVEYKANMMRYVDKIVTLGLPSPANLVFLYFLGFFILLLVLRVNPWVSLTGAIAFALSSYFFIILGAGHTSKAHAIGYMAPVLAGIILTYRGKYWQGALLTAIALALEIKAGHLQITYYLLIVIFFYGVYQIIVTAKDKSWPKFLKATGWLMLAAFLAILTHSTNLWATYEYGKETMRGKPELTRELQNKSSGLDRDYITAWSYGIGETWSLLVPDVKGGASGQIGNQKALNKADSRYRNIIAKQSSYWGDQPGTSGPVYVGAFVLFLAILGMFILDDRLKWMLFAVTVLSIMLAWGRNMMWFTDFFIDYVPGYNKFRAVSMTLVIAELAIPILAFMALNKIIQNPGIIKKNMRPFYISLGLTAGIILLFYILPTSFFSFLSQYEKDQFRQLEATNDPAQIRAFIDNLTAVRVAIFREDALRSLFFIIVGASLVMAFAYGKLKQGWLIAGITLLILIDLVGVDRRYINGANFVPAWQAEKPFKPSRADLDILKDKGPDFRVLDLSKSTFNDASCSYFHKSIGGYHGAKLQRYQDIIDEYLSPEIMDLRQSLPGQHPQSELEHILSRQQVLNMLNTRYVILRPDMMPLPNNNAFGNAWFVKNYVVVKNADEEIAALGKNNLRTTAVVDDDFKQFLPAKGSFGSDTAAVIRLDSYAPNRLVYSFSSKSDQMVVFSEIYYNKGWDVYLDGKKVPYFRANYILRAMTVPAGDHKIEWKFEPRVWVVGEKVSFASSLLLILLVLGFLVYEGKKYFEKRKKTDETPS